MSGDHLRDLTAQIVAGYVRRNQVMPHDMPTLIRTVHDSLANVGAASAEAERPTPVVPIRRSVTDEHIICLDCGYKGQMIRRHLQTKHSMTPEQYRERWTLPIDYPMLARGYSEKRSALAKSSGLGQRGRGRPAPIPEPPAAKPEATPAPAAPSRRRRPAAAEANGADKAATPEKAKPARRTRAKAKPVRRTREKASPETPQPA